MPAPARPAPPRHPPADTARTDLPSRPPHPPAAPPTPPDPAAHQLRSWAWTLEPLATTSHVNWGTHSASSVNRAQGLGLRAGQVAVQGDEPQPREQGRGDQ